MGAGLILSALGAGLLSFFSPCILPLLPVYAAILASGVGEESAPASGAMPVSDGVQVPGDVLVSSDMSASGDARVVEGAQADDSTRTMRRGTGRRLAATAAFVLGISTVFVSMGAGAGALGSLLNNAYVTIAAGLVVVLMGLYMADVLTIPALQRTRQINPNKIRARGVVGAFLLGLAFSFGWTPCVGPILGTILTMAASVGGAVPGALLLLVYSIGLCLPFAVLTLASDLILSRIKGLGRYLDIIRRIGGALLVIMGLWMTFAQVHDLITISRLGAEPASVNAIAAPQTTDGADQKGVPNAPGKQNSAGTPGEQSAATPNAGAPASDTEDAAGKDAQPDKKSLADAWKNVALTDLDGNTVHLSDFKGEPVYLEFWGTWCPVCMATLDQLAQTSAEHNSKGDVRVVSVVAPGTSGEKSADEFVQWAREEGIDFPVFMDTRASLVRFFGISGFPTSMFIGADGELVGLYVGSIEHEQLEGMLDQLAAGELK